MESYKVLLHNSVCIPHLLSYHMNFMPHVSLSPPVEHYHTGL